MQKHGASEKSTALTQERVTLSIEHERETGPGKERITFLTLPHEIITMIYTYAFSEGAPRSFDDQSYLVKESSVLSRGPDLMFAPSLLRVNRQIYRDAIGHLYAQPFVFYSTQVCLQFLNCTPDSSLAMIQHIRIYLGAQTGQLGGTETLDCGTLATSLGRLTTPLSWRFEVICFDTWAGQRRYMRTSLARMMKILRQNSTETEFKEFDVEVETLPIISLVPLLKFSQELRLLKKPS